MCQLKHKRLPVPFRAVGRWGPVCGLRLFPIIHTTLSTGMNRDELLAPKWEDVDISKRVVTVQRSPLYIIGEQVVREPKMRRATISATKDSHTGGAHTKMRA